MARNSNDWFAAKREHEDIGAEYEAKALKGHKYYVKVKSLHLLRKAKELFGDTKPLTCIDLGCGTGETMEYFQGLFGRLIGCDYSQGMLDFAAKKGLKNAEFRLSRSEELPFENGSADIVAMFGIIHHIDAAEKLIRTFSEVHRILKRGGVVAVYDFNPRNPVSRHIVRTCGIDVGVNLDGYARSAFPTTFYSEELIKILNDAGFRIAKHEYLLYFPKLLSALLPLERLLARVPLGGMYSIIGMK